MFGTPRAIAITSKAPHPAAARVFVDYWLSTKSMEILVKEVGEYVLAPGIYPPIGGHGQGQGGCDPRALRRGDPEVGQPVQEDLRRKVAMEIRIQG